MYLMFGDEADREAIQGKKFFVYGAIFAPTNSLVALHNAIEQLRIKNGMQNTDSLKSATNSRPKGMSSDLHRSLKSDVMQMARDVGNVKFCAQVTLHDLARNQEHDELVLWGANTVVGKFNQFLRENRTHGYCVLDKIPVEHPYRYLKEKFQVGNTFTGKAMRLDRIIGFGHAVDGSSHLCSVCDILLGAFRYCVNEPEKDEVGKATFPTLMSMMWKGQRDGNATVNDFGLCFRPSTIREAKHQAEYDSLSSRLKSYLEDRKVDR